MEVNRTTLSIAAGVAGTLFLGYCIYFDKKRRSDPEYKKKIRERKCGTNDDNQEGESRRVAPAQFRLEPHIVRVVRATRLQLIFSPLSCWACYQSS